MPIWKIEPLDSQNECWIYFYCRKPVIVRAHNEQAARTVAEVRLAALFGPPPEIYHGTSPWQDDSLSSCRQDEDSKYREEGPEELLEPLGV
jgi:hypothetical protein